MATSYSPGERGADESVHVRDRVVVSDDDDASLFARVVAFYDGYTSSFHTKDVLVRKLVHYFLFRTTSEKIAVPSVPELKDAKWFLKDDTAQTLGYSQNKDMFTKALEYIAEYEETGSVRGEA